MSITMNLYYTGKNGSASAFVKEMEESKTADLIRQEEGNEGYEYYISLADPETVLLIDSWANQQALDNHHKTPMMDTIAALREKYDLHMTAKRYVSDDLPQDDKKYIKE